VEYTLADGRTETVGESALSTKQKANMKVDEILALRDAGAGEIVSQVPFPMGLGKYVVRFTLSDGQTVDLSAIYPPGTREEREKIFAETRALKQQLRFRAVDSPSVNPDGSVWGILQYTLADGRVVGIVEEVPKGAITPDGTHVAVAESEATKDGSGQAKNGGHQTKNGWSNVAPEDAEAESMMEAGGGRLIGMHEGPSIVDGSSSQSTSFKVEFTLANGRIVYLGEGRLSEKQRANMRWDEISALRDAGAGQLISQEPFHLGLGKYMVRFTLSDGQTIDLIVNYPPGTRQDREKIFAETRALKKQLQFKVMRLPAASEGPASGITGGVLQYTLADGRIVGIIDMVPKDAIGPDGKLTVPEIEMPSPKSDRPGQ